MSNYTKTTDFEAKDSLPTGDSGKIIRGAEFETEFDAISTAIATKADTAGPTFTGTLTFETISDGTIGVTAFVDEDDMSSDSATLVPTQQSVKAYVDSQVTAQDLDFQADSGGALSIDLDSESLTFTGGTGIDTSGSLNTVTFAIDSTVATLTGTQTLTNKTLTSPDVNTPDIDGGTIDGATIATSDITVGTGKTLDVSGGTLTLANDQISGDKVEGGTIASTTITSLASTTVDTTNLEVTNIKAKDGTSAGSIADLTGVVTLASSVLTTTDINGGTIDGATIGATTPAAVSATTVSATGNITVGGTVDGRDVATDGTKLDGIEAGADVTDTTNVTAAGAVMDSELTSEASVKALDQGVATTDSPTFAGLTTTADVSFGDNDKAVFGAGSDLQIWHAGDASYIGEVGTGNLIIYGDTNIDIQNAAGQKTFRAESGGPAYLYYANNLKLNTSSTGIDVTGTVTADGLTVDGDVAIASNLPSITLTDNNNSSSRTDIEYNFGYLAIDADANNVDAAEAIDLKIGGNLHFRLATGGDISFYEDTGTTAKFFWDASAEQLQLGDSFGATNAPLLIQGSSYDPTTNGGINSGGLTIRGGTSASGNNTGALIFTMNQGGSNAGSAGVSGVQDTASDDQIGLAFFTHGSSSASSAAAERMRIDSSGNLLVGTTSTTLYNGTSGTGFSYRAGNELTVARSGASVATFVRQSTDGDILSFKKDGSTVGSIGTDSNSELFISGAGNRGGIGFYDHTTSAAIRPVNSDGTLSDGDTDLGYTDSRWKDLYLSNKVHLQYPGNSYYAKVEVDSSTNLILGAGPNGAERARIDSSGNLLVGTTSSGVAGSTTNDGVQLQQSGAINAAVNGAPVAYFNRQTSDGDVIVIRKAGSTVGSISVASSTTSYNTSSDRRLKDNIVDAPSASDDIDAIQVRSFDWKIDGSHQKYGMVAQELQSVAPEAVSGDADSDDMMGVDYSKLVPMLVKEIQSLRARVAQLEGEN